jgi:asparaginyl-tRNA synthetase
MSFNYIKELKDFEGKQATLKGWVTTNRTGKEIAFVVLRDGTGFCQCVIDEEKIGGEMFQHARSLTLESSVSITGEVVKDDKQVGGYEIHASSLEVIHLTEDYPIAKKEHGVEFLLDRRHLWLRSSRQWAMLRVRSKVVFTIHKFFQERDFQQLDPPIFTGNACEGTTTLFETDFYGQPAYLSQSGQLYGEAMAMAHGKIYTFGPTFRAEKSKTRRHLSEFWMIEPEMAFFDLDMDMDLIEEFLQYVIKEALENCKTELEILGRNTEMLENVAQEFPRITYEDAVSIIKGEKEVDGQNSIAVLNADLENVKEQISESQKEIEERTAVIEKGGIKKGVVNFNKNKIDKLKAEVKELEEKETNIPQWIESAKNFERGGDFGGSDETVLTRLFSTPVMVYNWPQAIKAFYMKRDENDDNSVKGVDVLAPEGYGEIVGGGEREDNVQNLLDRIKAHELPQSEFEWYLDLRRFGSVPHSGFGLGLERLVAWICGTPHIRETIPFPRFYGRLMP